MQQSRSGTYTRIMTIAAWSLIIAGAIFRIYVYLQNRNLIIDEANIARNIYERGFVELIKPLSYEQYAPPVFLWITKLNTILFGFGEQSLRLYPLLCGIAALYIMYRVLKELIPVSAIWYPLSLIAFAHIFIRYSSEVKQYMSDVLVVLLLVLLALKIDLFKKRPLQFTLLWIIAGSVAIWSSMPSVFVLAGVGAYYGWQCIAQKEYRKILPLIIIAVTWIAQFGIYYFTILEPQAQSDYLQNFHRFWFLYATPNDHEQWQHNLDIFSGLLFQFEGLNDYVHTINIGLLLAGAIVLFVRGGAKGFLLVMPVVALLAAAALNRFSLIPRVSLFGITLMIIIIGYAFGQMAYFRSGLLKILFIGIGLFCGISNVIQAFEEDDFKYEEITTAMQFLDDKHIPGAAISVVHNSVPAFRYYTQIHPDSNRWQRIKNADLYQWATNYDSLAYHMRYLWSSRQPLGFIYTNATPEEISEKDRAIHRLMNRVDSVVLPYVRCYVYIKPLPADTTTVHKEK